MADFEAEQVEVQDQPKPKRKKVKSSGGGGGSLSPLTLLSLGIALAAIAFSVILFMQLQKVNAQLAGKGEIQSKGHPDAMEDATGEDGHEMASHRDPESLGDERVTRNYDLGKFTASTADSKYVKMEVTLRIKSGFTLQDEERYQFLEKKYEMDLHHYQEAVEKYMKDQKLAMGDSGVVNAMHGAPAAETGPPEPPVPPEEPVTKMESALDYNKVIIRDRIINMVSGYTSSQLNTPGGKATLKTQIKDMITGLIDPWDTGEVIEVLLPDFITT